MKMISDHSDYGDVAVITAMPVQYTFLLFHITRRDGWNVHY